MVMLVQVQTTHFQLATLQAGDRKAKELALIVPGKLDTKDYAHLTELVEYFAQIGFFAVSFDPPGTWESGGEIEDYTVTNYLAAIDEVIEHFGNRPTVMVGHSRGGSVSINAAARNSHITRVVTLMSRAEILSEDSEWKARGYVDEYRDLPPGRQRTPKASRRHFRLPYSFHIDAMQYDTVAALKSLTQPKLFFSGAQDKITSPTLIEKAFTLATDPKMYHQVDFGHDIRLDQTIIDEVKTVISEFLERHPA